MILVGVIVEKHGGNEEWLKQIQDTYLSGLDARIYDLSAAKRVLG